MASLRDIRRRIQSVKNTRQITRAMKLVAGAKLRKATETAVAARPYQRTLQRVIERVVRGAGDVEHPLLTVPDNRKDVLVVLMTSNRGLCGSFNNALCRSTQDRVDKLVAEGKQVRIMAFGKKGKAYFEKRGYKVVSSRTDLSPDAYAGAAETLAETLVAELNDNRFETAILAYNEFRSVMVQQASFEQVLPMKLEVGDDGEQTTDYIYEPEGQEILSGLLPMALRTRLYQAFLETEAGEQAARMTAMDNATRNASELIDGLTLEYNRARQAAITKELIEIVSGAEAL